MGYTDPQTVHNPSTGGIAPAAWGDTVRDDLEFLVDPPRGLVRHNTTQPHNSTGNYVTCLANTEDKDTDGCHSTSSSTSRITIVTAGDYWFEAVIEWASSGSGNRAAKLIKTTNSGGTTADIFGDSIPSSTGIMRTSVAAFIPGLVAGDYVEAAGFQGSGGNLNMQLIRLSWRYVGR